MFSCEYCEIFKNTYFEERLRTPASVLRIEVRNKYVTLNFLATSLKVVSATLRGSHQRCSVRIRVVTNFAKFTGKQLCQILFFNKVTGLRPATLFKNILWHRYFPVNFVKFLRIPFYRTPPDDCFSTFFLFWFVCLKETTCESRKNV